MRIFSVSSDSAVLNPYLDDAGDFLLGAQALDFVFCFQVEGDGVAGGGSDGVG